MLRAKIWSTNGNWLTEDSSQNAIACSEKQTYRWVIILCSMVSMCSSPRNISLLSFSNPKWMVMERLKCKLKQTIYKIQWAFHSCQVPKKLCFSGFHCNDISAQPVRDLLWWSSAPILYGLADHRLPGCKIQAVKEMERSTNHTSIWALPKPIYLSSQDFWEVGNYYCPLFRDEKQMHAEANWLR